MWLRKPKFNVSKCTISKLCGGRLLCILSLCYRSTSIIIKPASSYVYSTRRHFIEYTSIRTLGCFSWRFMTLINLKTQQTSNTNDEITQYQVGWYVSCNEGGDLVYILIPHSWTLSHCCTLRGASGEWSVSLLQRIKCCSTCWNTSSNNIDQFLFDLPNWCVCTSVALLWDATLLHLESFMEGISMSETRWCGSWSSGSAFYWCSWSHHLHSSSENWRMLLLNGCSWWMFVARHHLNHFELSMVYSVPNISCCMSTAQCAWKRYSLGHDYRWNSCFCISKSDTHIICHNYFDMLPIKSTRTVEQVGIRMTCLKTFYIEFASAQAIWISRRMSRYITRLCFWSKTWVTSYPAVCYI